MTLTVSRIIAIIAQRKLFLVYVVPEKPFWRSLFWKQCTKNTSVFMYLFSMYLYTSVPTFLEIVQSFQNSSEQTLLDCYR